MESPPPPFLQLAQVQLQQEDYTRQALADAVVEFARQAVAFLVLDGKHLFLQPPATGYLALQGLFAQGVRLAFALQPSLRRILPHRLAVASDAVLNAHHARMGSKPLVLDGLSLRDQALGFLMDVRHSVGRPAAEEGFVVVRRLHRMRRLAHARIIYDVSGLATKGRTLI